MQRVSVIAPVQRANHGTHFRAYGLRGGAVATLIDPFIGVDHAWMSAPTFPRHRHSGFSAVSYVFLDSETGIRNRDSLENDNLIRPGGLHWMTAGRGVMHEEAPAETGKTAHSLRIFVNLAHGRQSLAPLALNLEPQNVPVVQVPGAKVRVPLGSYLQTRSPLTPPIEVNMLDVSLEDGAKLTVPIGAGQSAFVMPIFGAMLVDGDQFDRDDLTFPVFLAEAEPRTFTVEATKGCAKVAVFSGRPLDWPRVSNSH
jgi:redox-sensitive bicupin YhaK (pirin superfamily)